MPVGNDIKPTFGSTTYVPATATYVTATTSEATKYKEKKVSVIENEKDRFELSENYKQFLSLRHDYDDLRQQFDVDNLTHDEYLKMCKMIKDNGGHNSLNAEEYAWGQSYCDNYYHPPSGTYIELPQKDYDRLMAMADTHSDPFRFGRILDFATKRRDAGNPITFEQMLDLADPSKTPNWIDEDTFAPTMNFGYSDPNKRYNWVDVMKMQLTNIDKLPHIKPEDKASFKNATMKMLDILNQLKIPESHLNSELHDNDDGANPESTEIV